MSPVTRHHLDLFWHLLDEILNTVLFVLIGLEVLVMPFREHYLVIVLMLTPLVLLARLISVGVPFSMLRARWRLSNTALGVMVWGGLRGSVDSDGALAAIGTGAQSAGRRDLRRGRVGTVGAGRFAGLAATQARCCR